MARLVIRSACAVSCVTISAVKCWLRSTRLSSASIRVRPAHPAPKSVRPAAAPAVWSPASSETRWASPPDRFNTSRWANPSTPPVPEGCQFRRAGSPCWRGPKHRFSATCPETVGRLHHHAYPASQFARGKLVIVLAARYTVPPVGSSSRLIRRRNDDLPAPLGPTTASISPCCACTLISFTSTFPVIVRRDSWFRELYHPPECAAEPAGAP